MFSATFKKSATFSIATIALLLGFSRTGHSSTGGIEPLEIRGLKSRLNNLKARIDGGDYASSVSPAKALVSEADATARADLELRARALLGAAEVGAGLYREALQTLLPARILARRLRDRRRLFSVCNNAAWVHLKMENFEAAADFADEAIAASDALGKYDARPRLLRALIYARSMDFPPAEKLFSEVISRSMDSEDLNSAAIAWNYIGAAYFLAGRTSEAEIAQTESFRLRRLHHLPQLEVSLRDLGAIRSEEGDLRSASVLIEEALQMIGTSPRTAVYVYYQERGRLKMLKGDLAGALTDLRVALDLARRTEVIPTDDDRITFESRVEELSSLFIEAGNRLYLNNQDPLLKSEVFDASEEYRAASLRALVPQPNGWRTRLPAEYGQLLARLESAERSLLTGGDPQAAGKARILRANLRDMELRAGAEEEFNQSSALDVTRRAIDGDTAVLTFQIGPRTSWMWAVTNTRFDVYELPNKTVIASDGERLDHTIRSQMSGEAGAAGGKLYEELFGKLPADVQSKRRWVVVLDKELFELPLGALRSRTGFLVEEHTLVLGPSVRLLRPAVPAGFAGSMIAVGDPVYNQADPRWRRDRFWFSLGNGRDALHLARLTGSGREADAAVRTWGDGRILEGDSASKENIKRVLEDHPAILHLATHVIRAPQSRSGIIVLSLNSDGRPDFLAMRDIVTESLVTRLVVMSGCASGDAEALPASGLMGLTRAWLGAGAEDVLATKWPQLDDSGPFFEAFYRNLKDHPRDGAAEALRRAQVEMIKSGTFRARPDYWASYFLVGKA